MRSSLLARRRTTTTRRRSYSWSGETPARAPLYFFNSLLVCLLPLMAAAQGVLAQVPERWNDARALALVERAREVRESVVIDSAFHSYRGEARGYVYFFIDRPDSDDRTLVKADQIALDVFWQAPNDIRQQIVGLRDAKVLPTNIRYHLDHLTVVQDDFGDFIRLGDGDEVEQVLHPVGPASEDKYDFLLADSLTISYGGGAKEVRVYELRIRPRDYDAPGFVGSIFLDRASAAIVRMNFTFTPAAYVDPYLDYIRISLDNALWEGKYWLPYRQEVELRRELPVLDFLAGSIIRGRFEIGGYEFNADMPPAVRLGRRVTSVSAAERAAFPFERGLFDDLQEDGLASSPSMAEIRERASQILRQRFSSGLSPIRLYFGSASDLSRHNRAEGQFLGRGGRCAARAGCRPTHDGRVRDRQGQGIRGFRRDRRTGTGRADVSRLLGRPRGHGSNCGCLAPRKLARHHARNRRLPRPLFQAGRTTHVFERASGGLPRERSDGATRVSD